MITDSVPAVDETTRHRVDELDFAGIGLREWFGTVVRCVRVDEVDPQQRGPTSVDSLQPFLHANDRLIAAVFLGPCTGLAVGGLEAEDLLLLEAAPAGDRRGRISGRLGDLGQCLAATRRVDTVPVDAVHRRRAAGHQAGVRRRAASPLLQDASRPQKKVVGTATNVKVLVRVPPQRPRIGGACAGA
ncbi:MAG: hypothetical protein VCF24_13125, partial [Candidatus Latescibacterota bacterium]